MKSFRLKNGHLLARMSKKADTSQAELLDQLIEALYRALGVHYQYQWAGNDPMADFNALIPKFIAQIKARDLRVLKMGIPDEDDWDDLEYLRENTNVSIAEIYELYLKNSRKSKK